MDYTDYHKKCPGITLDDSLDRVSLSGAWYLQSSSDYWTENANVDRVCTRMILMGGELDDRFW